MTNSLSMTTEQQDLYERIKAFRFDDDTAVFPFASRLARDNGWSKGYTTRVISEYRKFAFLAVAAGHPVTPSDQVDQAWHLHLLYTRSYWNRFCKEALGKPLHHGPTKGGGEEREKFNEWYGETLESYRRFFGEDPPDDIWPKPKIRFGADIHYQRVNTRRFWIVRKFPAKRLAWIVGGVLLALVLTGCGGGEAGVDVAARALSWISILLVLRHLSKDQGPTTLDLAGTRLEGANEDQEGKSGFFFWLSGCGGSDGDGGDGGRGGCG